MPSKKRNFGWMMLFTIADCNPLYIISFSFFVQAICKFFIFYYRYLCHVKFLRAISLLVLLALFFGAGSFASGAGINQGRNVSSGIKPCKDLFPDQLVESPLRLEAAILKTVIHHNLSSRTDNHFLRDIFFPCFSVLHTYPLDSITLNKGDTPYFVTVQEKIIFPFHFFL